jgi:hypothetical protein
MSVLRYRKNVPVEDLQVDECMLIRLTPNATMASV